MLHNRRAINRGGDKVSKAREYSENILQQFDKAKDYLDQLSSELSRNDLAIQDILHFIEFSYIDSILAYPTIKKLKELRLERRAIKNELEPLQKLICSIDKSKLQKVHAEITKMEEVQKVRKYTPRIYREGLEELEKVSNY